MLIHRVMWEMFLAVPCDVLVSPGTLERAGLSVLLQYKEGSSRQGTSSGKYANPNMKWIGLRPSQLDSLDLPRKVHHQRPLDFVALVCPPMRTSRTAKITVRCHVHRGSGSLFLRNVSSTCGISILIRSSCPQTRTPRRSRSEGERSLCIRFLA